MKIATKATFAIITLVFVLIVFGKISEHTETLTSIFLNIIITCVIVIPITYWLINKIEYLETISK